MWLWSNIKKHTLKKNTILNVYAIWNMVLSVFLGVHASLQVDLSKKYIVDFSFL